MLHQTDIKQAIDDYSKTAENAIKDASRAILPEPIRIQFPTCAISSDYVKEKSQEIPTGKHRKDDGSEFIYIFSISEKSIDGSLRIEEEFTKKRLQQAQKSYPGKKNLCQFNNTTAENRVIYVGRSYSPRERFKQHLLESIGGTYAIHFQSWSTKLQLHVNFFCYQFHDISSLAAQVLEDGLWDHLKPILGKRGAR